MRAVVRMRKPLSTSILPFALSTGLPFAVRAGKANVFFVQSGGNLTRSHISPERNELRSRRYAGRATEFLCDEWLGARQSANSSFLRGSVSLCEPFRVSNATGPRSLEKKSESLFVHRRTYEPFSCRTFGARSCRHRRAAAFRVRAKRRRRIDFKRGILLKSVFNFEQSDQLDRFQAISKS